MIKFQVIIVGFACACASMSMVAKTSKSMTLKGPNGSKKMFVEHSATSDLESSASGYIYRSNGNQPATIVKLGEPGYHEPQEFRQLLSHTYQHLPLVQPYPAPTTFAQERFVQDGGRWSDHGQKGSKGHERHETVDEALDKKHHRDRNSEFHKDFEGKKNVHRDEGGNYENHDESSEGESGESFERETSHKKGHKTTGYHNIYHKDEFKKQHSFYDEADGRGSYDKYGKGVENYGSDKGGYKKGDHLDSAHQVSHYGKKGGFDKGSFSEGSKGFLEVEGGNSHFTKNSEYGNKGGKSFQKDYGFSTDSGFDHED